MSKEELKKEVEEKAKKRTKGFKCQDNCEKSYIMGALDFAEPREKCITELEKENAELKSKLNKYKHDCPNCPAFGKHCPHKVNGDPYFYDCYLTVCELEKENAELKTVKIPQLERRIASIRGAHSVDCKKLNARTEQVERLKKENAELKELIADLKNYCCEVSKYLHDNSVARPDASAYKKRDALLIKEFKLCEKWGDLK